MKNSTPTESQLSASLLSNAIRGPAKIGRYEVHAIETGRFALDGGAMFGIVPKTIWNKTNPADDLNRIEMRLRCLLLIERNAQTGKPIRVALIDNGIGTKWTERFADIYKIDHTAWSLETELARLHLSTQDITDLIATHFHFDHMGGTTRRINNELVPTFPNAKLWVQRQNWNLAHNPNEKDRASYLAENFQIYENDSKLCLLDSTCDSRDEFLPGIFARASNGHTLGLQMIEVSDGDNGLIYCADAIPTATHIRVPYVMGYDCYPLIMIEEKKKLLREAESRGLILVFEHCPRTDGATIFHDGKDFSVKQAYKLSRD